ncbi:MAG: serine hydrolase [Verrucomicrobiales bacterium]|nr:serine hydrolase [Verrucomicrobiales bacterium]|tara:strand:- start:1231 stop:2451 length:1221 start_codon:yes stop_codon:yes gene_type:complete
MKLNPIFVQCLSIVLCLPATAGTIDPKAVAEARKLVHQAVADGKIAGAAHLVLHRGKVAYLDTVGAADIETKQPFAKDTIVRIYSMTKPITSVAAMKLFEEGKFELDDPVSKYIPAFKNVKVYAGGKGNTKLVDPKRPLSVRDVFRHTAGYSYGGGNSLEAHKREGMRYHGPGGMWPPSMTIEEAAEALARIPLLHQPGERFTYGYNTDLLGRLIEVWSGKSLAEHMRESVLEPLEMKDTGFSVPKDKRARFASCHTTRGGKLGIVDKNTTSQFNEGFDFLSGGGGLVSTIRDYGNFCQMLANRGTYKGSRILKKSTIEEMFTNQLRDVPGKFQFGLGFAIKQVRIGTGDTARDVTEYSWGGYASTNFRIVPDEGLSQVFLRQHVPSRHGLAGKAFPIVYRGIRTK